MDQKLKNEIEKKLDKMEANLENQETVRLRWQFVDKFILCEVACKLVLQAYHKSEGNEVALKDEKLIMNSILAAMKWAKMDFTKEELEAMFSSQGKLKKRGSKSAKMLRHGSMHEHNEQDILEIVSRFDELDHMMDAFLDKFSQVQTEQKPKETKKRTSKGKSSGKRKPERTSGASPVF